MSDRDIRDNLGALRVHGTKGGKHRNVILGSIFVVNLEIFICDVKNTSYV